MQKTHFFNYAVKSIMLNITFMLQDNLQDNLVFIKPGCDFIYLFFDYLRNTLFF